MVLTADGSKMMNKILIAALFRACEAKFIDPTLVENQFEPIYIVRALGKGQTILYCLKWLGSIGYYAKCKT